VLKYQYSRAGPTSIRTVLAVLQDNLVQELALHLIEGGSELFDCNNTKYKIVRTLQGVRPRSTVGPAGVHTKNTSIPRIGPVEIKKETTAKRLSEVAMRGC